METKMERTDRIEEEIKKIVSKLIENGIKDPRVDGLVSVTKVEVSKDMKYCKIYVSMIGSTDNNAVLEGLNSAKGVVRKEIGSKIRTFNTPEVKFIYDDSMAYGQHIENILSTLDIKHDEEDETATDNTDKMSEDESPEMDSSNDEE
jgi:ribosome-binding factor A